VSEIQLVESTYVIKQVKFRHFVDQDGMPWFVAKDVCEYLDLADTSSACRKVWDECKGSQNLPTLGGSQDMITVNEPGLYQLIFQSRKPEAIAFQRWVFSDLLPRLRRDGSYQLRDHVVLAPAAAADVMTRTPTRFGRQPISDVLRHRQVSNDAARDSMNAMNLPGVPLINTSYYAQLIGKNAVKEALAFRSQAYLRVPLRSLFTELALSRLKHPAADHTPLSSRSDEALQLAWTVHNTEKHWSTGQEQYGQNIMNEAASRDMILK
jgi:prophage antirepressor-like protein